jgi:SOS-response transcriptional repressor LexA
MNTKEVRRQNLRALVRTMGGVTAFANRIGRMQSQISHITSANPCKNIGDKLATLIEHTFNKPSGWLDKVQTQEAELNTLVEPQVPLIPWIDINESISLDNSLRKSRLLIPTKSGYSEKAFALQVERDDMQRAQGISFPQGSTIIVDPEYLYKNGSFVIASIRNQEWAMFRQLTIVDNKYIFNALNDKYRSIEVLQEFVKIHGVVRYAFMEFQ